MDLGRRRCSLQSNRLRQLSIVNIDILCPDALRFVEYHGIIAVAMAV